MPDIHDVNRRARMLHVRCSECNSTSGFHAITCHLWDLEDTISLTTDYAAAIADHESLLTAPGPTREFTVYSPCVGARKLFAGLSEWLETTQGQFAQFCAERERQVA